MRTKSAILIMGINDTMMSYDLHIIEVMNSLRSRIDELTWMKLANELMGLYNSPNVLPYHELVYKNNKLELVELGKVNTTINEYNYWDVIYSKKDVFISKHVYDKICDMGYRKVIENTPVRFVNVNTINFLLTFNNFVILNDEYKWSELPILNHIAVGDNQKQIISKNKLGKWLDDQTVLDGNGDSLAILLTLISPYEDVDKEVGEICLKEIDPGKHDLIACESRIITYNPRIDVKKLKELSDKGLYKRSNLAGAKLFNPNMVSKR